MTSFGGFGLIRTTRLVSVCSAVWPYLAEPNFALASQAHFISVCMDECRNELRGSEINVKVQAVAKLNYVGCQRVGRVVRHSVSCFSPTLQMQMLGYDVSWAAFNVSISAECDLGTLSFVFDGAFRSKHHP